MRYSDSATRMNMPKLKIVGIGIDLVDIEAFRRARFKKRVADYFLTKEERVGLPKGRAMTQFLASRFAAKEAVIKAFPGTLSPLEFSIKKQGPKPQIVFYRAYNNKKYFVQISIAHTANAAAAVAIILAL